MRETVVRSFARNLITNNSKTASQAKTLLISMEIIIRTNNRRRLIAVNHKSISKSFYRNKS